MKGTQQAALSLTLQNFAICKHKNAGKEFYAYKSGHWPSSIQALNTRVISKLYKLYIHEALGVL